ncbi:HK97 gp10 family phage protein [Mesorhizobium sp. M0757]|uniref:HK97-gp10 family putative phage morphogenesis protein n=1 Tax=Mesorhizobium sp. M0757 TaxID=2956993 RepID=UPI00333C10F6
MANDDLASLLKAFDAIPREARKAIPAAINKGAGELLARMQYLAPDDTGELKRSIKKTELNELAVRVGSDDPNAQYQEYGVLHHGDTNRSANSQPWFWPSVNTLKKRVRSRVDRAISKAVKEAFK